MSTTRELETTLGAALGDLQAAERELSRWRRWSGPVFLLTFLAGFLFALWLAAKVNGPVTIRTKGNAGPAVELGTADASEPNMMTVSLVHRFRFQNKG